MDQCKSRRTVVAWYLLSVVVAGGLFAGDREIAADSREFKSVRAQKAEKAISMDLLDLVVVVDNSGSMTAAISSLQTGFYSNLVAPLIAEGVDVRVIVVSRHGSLGNQSTCFESPLSSIPNGGCNTPPAQPGNTANFKHYSVEIGSLDLWCLVLSTFDGTTPDDFGLFPSGWATSLREEALKLFLVVSDDRVGCGSYDDGDSIAGGGTAAEAIDTDLLALSESQFGTESNRKYAVHSLVGLEPNSVPTEPWPPSSPITGSQCGGAISAGTGHQGISILTRGLRFPVCATSDYDIFLDDLAVDTALRLPIFSDGFESGNPSDWSSTVP